MNNRRVILVILVMFIAMLVLASRLYNIQITNHKKYLSIALKQQNKTITVAAERGLILDKDNEVLSYTQNDISLFVDTRMVDEKKSKIISKKISELFGNSEKYYLNKINNGTKNVCLEKKVPKEIAIQLEDFTVEGFFIEEDYSRKYPYGSLSSHILGYVDVEGKGVNGIEKVYDEYLEGSDGVKSIENDVLGRTVTIKDDRTQNAIPGNNVVLTIKKSYQQILEQELRSGLENYHGENAVGIIMNPNTGEIMAMANVPDFDPNNYNLFNDDARRNRILTDTYEPGSTIKPIIMSMLIEEDLVTPDEQIDTENGLYKIRGANIRDTHEYEHLSVRQVIEQSSNIGMTKLSTRINPELFYKYLRDFGFGNITSVDLPGEIEGFLKKPKNYSRISKNFISFGYEISVTPLQLISAYSAVINGGTLYKPLIVKEIRNYKGDVIQKFEAERIRNVISRRTSDMLIDFMIGVVEEGTGKYAQLDNVLVGGKTGTSQKLIDGKYSSQHYNSSFVGFFPADNPKLICLVVVNSPKIGRYGGQVAAPIFREIASKIIEADYSIVPEDLKIKRQREIVDELFAQITANSDEPVFTTSNLAEVEIDSKPQVAIDQNGLMPNLLNKSKRDAVAMLNELKIEFKIIGNGKVLTQSILPGSNISPGQVCLIKCETVKNNSGIRIY